MAALVRSRPERLAALPLREGLRVAAVTGLVRALAGYALVTALVVAGAGLPTTAASPEPPTTPLRVVELDPPLAPLLDLPLDTPPRPRGEHTSG